MPEEGFQKNPSLFRKMNEPFENDAAARDAINAFNDELGQLRVKHKITDILCVIGGAVKAADDDEVAFLMTCFYGSQDRAEYMAAYAFGREQEARDNRVKKAMTKRPL